MEDHEEKVKKANLGYRGDSWCNNGYPSSIKDMMDDMRDVMIDVR